MFLLLLAHLGSPGQRAVKRLLCCCVCHSVYIALLSSLVIGDALVFTQCLKKTVQNCLCQNFFKFPPILIIFGRKMAKRLKLCEVHSLSTLLNSCLHTTVLSVDVPNCYTTLKFVSIRLLTIASSIQ